MVDQIKSFPYTSIYKNAFTMCMDRLWQYILVSLASIALFLIWFLFVGILSISFLFIGKLIHPILLFLLIIPLACASLGTFFYISSWSQLAILDVFVNVKKHMPIKERFKKVQPLVIGFIWFNILSFLFILGLIPLGILSLGLVLLYWSILGTFAGFIYLLHKPAGLGSLWKSATMSKKYIMHIAVVLAITYGAVLFIDSILLKSDKVLPQLFLYIKNIFVTPFIIALKYQIFRTIPEIQKVDKFNRWIMVSKIGLIVMILICIFSINLFIKLYPSLRNMPIKSPTSIPIEQLI